MDGNCAGLTIEICSYISMLNYSQPIYDECKNFCNGKEMFVNIAYKDFSVDLANIFRNNLNYKFNKFICTECLEGYYLLENKTCRQNKTFPHKPVIDLSNCNMINIGKDSDTKEILSCESCKNESDVL